MRGDIPDKTGVDGEPFDVTFVAAIKKDWAETRCAHPVFGVDKVTLSEVRKIREAEMVQSLREVPGFVTVLLVVGFD